MRNVILSVGLFALFFAATPASAAVITFDACTEASLCGHLSMTTTLVDGVMNVQVAGDGNYGIFGQSGANRAFGFNVVGSEAGLLVFNLTPGFTYGGTDQQISDFGDFEQFINGPRQGANAALPLNFSVSRTGGFALDTDLFDKNADGYLAAGHLRFNTNGSSGFVAATVTGDPNLQQTAVPEPASMILLGTGLLAAFRARKKAGATSAEPNVADRLNA